MKNNETDVATGINNLLVISNTYSLMIVNNR